METNSAAKEKKNSWKSYWVELCRFIDLDTRQQTLPFCRTHQEKHHDMTDCTLPVEEGCSLRPCSAGRLLRNPAEKPRPLSGALPFADWHFTTRQGKARTAAAKPHSSRSSKLHQKETYHLLCKLLRTSLLVNTVHAGISLYAAEPLIFPHLPTKHPSNTPPSISKPRSNSLLSTQQISLPRTSTNRILPWWFCNIL